MGAEAESEAQTEPEPEPNSEPEPEAEAEPEAAPETEAGSEPEPETEPEPRSEPEPEAEAEAEAEPEAQPEHEHPTDVDLCVPIGECGAYGWCNQDLYVRWCHSEGQTSVCPAVFCKILPRQMQLRQRKQHRMPNLRAHRTLGTALLQHSSELATSVRDASQMFAPSDVKSEGSSTCIN